MNIKVEEYLQSEDFKEKQKKGGKRRQLRDQRESGAPVEMQGNNKLFNKERGHMRTLSDGSDLEKSESSSVRSLPPSEYEKMI